MSIFSHLRRSRQQAKEHTAKVAEQRRKEEDKIPYKHIPTHAAADAIASAPPSWREEADRPKIIEQNRRRSAMAAAGFSMSMSMSSNPGIPRIGSSLSHVSYPNGDATPIVRVPRTQSYTSIYQYSGQRDIIYSMPDASFSQPTWKGKEALRASVHDLPMTAAGSTKGDRSNEGSTHDSSSSQDELEMKPANANAKSKADRDSVHVHRLHPSRSRRPSDASERQGSATLSPPKMNGSRDSRPPPSIRGFSSIPPPVVNSSAPLNNFAGNLAPSFSTPVVIPSAGIPPPPTSSKRNSFSASLPVVAPTTTTNNSLAQFTFNSEQSDTFLQSLSLPGPELDVGGVPAETTTYGNQTTNSSIRPKESRKSSSDRFRQPDMSQFTPDRIYSNQMPAPLAHEDLVNVFPEPASYFDDQQEPASKKSKKLSKSGGKLSKKNRWSLSRRPELAV